MSKKKRTTALAPLTRDVVVPSWGTMVGGTSIQSSAYPLTVVEAAGVSAVRRCVSLIANAIAGQRWTEWEGEPPERLPVVSRIVKRPASLMTRREWVWRVVASMALDDISYLYMVGGVDDEGVPGSLLPLPREAIAPAGYTDPWGIFPPTSYTIAGAPSTVSGEAVIPVRSAFWPGVPPHLQGILRMARHTLMQAWASDVYVSRYWQEGGSPITQISTDQELTNEQADGMASRYRERRAKGPDWPLVIGKGGKAAPFGADVSQAAAVEARREIVIEVANLFGVAAHYVNVTPTGNSMTYSNLQDEALSLERFTLSGFVDPIQDVISDLLPEGRYMLIDMTKLTRAAQESRFRAWQIATGNKAWMMPEEVRVEEGMPRSADIEAMQEAQVKGSEAAADSFANRASGGAAPKADAAVSDANKEPVNAGG